MEASRFPEACVSERPTFLISCFLCKIKKGHLSFSKIITTKMWILICFLNSCKKCRSPHCSGRATASQHIPCLPKTPRKDRENDSSSVSVINTMAKRWLCEKPRATNSCIVFGIVRNIELFGSDQESTYICTSSCWFFWWPFWLWNDAFVTAEHHAWEFLNSFHVLLVLVNSRPANCDSLMVLGQSSTYINYSRFPKACLKRRNSCALKYFGVLHLVLSRRNFSCE